MEPEGSLPHSQVLATYPCPEPHQFSPYSLSRCLKIHNNIILPSTPRSSKWSLSYRFPHQNPVYTSPLSHMCCMSPHLILPDLITRIILGEECRPLSSLLLSFLDTPITSSLLDPNILLSTLFSNNLTLRPPSM